MTPPKGSFQISVRYRIGCGLRATLAREAGGIGITNALIVTDRGVAGLGWFDPMVQAARDDGLNVEVYDEVRSNPTLDNVEAGLERYRAGDHDGLILVGGGSAMDAGKAIAMMAGHPGSLFDYEFLAGERWKQIDATRIAPTIAMPTTSGSGSELSPGLIITEPAAGVKRSIINPALVPTSVLADPETTLDLPPALTAATGMDAVTHCFESLCSPRYHPMADGMALEGLRLLQQNLPVCYREPHEASARTQVMMAAGQAALAFQKGLGLTHAMAHPLGAVTDIHHGLANAILLPYVMKHNRDVIAEHTDRVARYLGLPGSGFDAVMAWVLELRQQLAIPSQLAGVAGIEDTGLATILAPKAAAEAAYLSTNPKPCTTDQIEAVYVAAIEGSL